MGQTLGSIVFDSWNARWGVLTLVGLCLLALVVAYSSGKRTAIWRWGLALMKLASMGLIALCLLEPTWSESRVKPGENIVVLLADGSSSLQIRSEGKSRGELFREQLEQPDLPWQTRLAQDFDVRRYLFGSRLKQVQGFAPQAVQFQIKV